MADRTLLVTWCPELYTVANSGLQYIHVNQCALAHPKSINMAKIILAS